MKAHFAMFARYNEWANRRLYDAAAKLPDAQPLAPALAHFFNHQTHHRGQVHGLMTALAGRDAAPSLDLILFQRETGIGLS
jgi:uncharacterized damage-inducible protein DinB